jgi:hypothetical protein
LRSLHNRSSRHCIHPPFAAYLPRGRVVAVSAFVSALRGAAPPNSNPDLAAPAAHRVNVSAPAETEREGKTCNLKNIYKSFGVQAAVYDLEKAAVGVDD